jgi:hypothetical protein
MPPVSVVIPLFRRGSTTLRPATFYVASWLAPHNPRDLNLLH